MLKVKRISNQRPVSKNIADCLTQYLILQFLSRITAKRFPKNNLDFLVFATVYFLIMFSYLNIVEKKIREAIEKGEFENLPGKGKPLDLEDDSRIPEDLRLAYKVLKNANCLPKEIELKKEILSMEEMLDKLPDEKSKYHLIKKINFTIMKLNSIRNKSPLLEENQLYYSKLINRLDKK